MKYIVYKTINLINNKIYIGVHKTENPDIFDGYIGCGVNVNYKSTYSNPITIFQKAVKKYGVNNFKRIVLHVYDNSEQAYSLEKKIVNHNFIKSDRTYNMILGGGFMRESEPVYQYNKDCIMIKMWNSISDASEYYHINIQSIKNAIHFKELYLECFWSRYDYINIDEMSKGDQKKIVYQYDKNGVFECQYNSITDASKQLNARVSSISNAINGNTLFRKQNYLSFEKYKLFVPKKKISIVQKEYYIYNDKGIFIRKLDNYKDVIAFCGMRTYSDLYRAFNTYKGKYKSYFIMLNYMGVNIDVDIKNNKKKVDVFSSDGVYICTCDSIYQTCRKFNVRNSDINRVLRGLAKTSNGFIFKFHIGNNDIV